MNKDNLQNIAETLLDTFFKAGDVAKEIAHKGVKISIKADNSPVTNGDLAVDKILREKNVADETSTEFIEVLKSCEFARYTPASNTAQHEDYEKAVKVISKLDKDL